MEQQCPQISHLAGSAMASVLGTDKALSLKAHSQRERRLKLQTHSLLSRSESFSTQRIQTLACIQDLNQHQQVLAVLLVAEEGPVDGALAEAIWQGKRRPTGHLLPQTLIAQEGCLEAASFRAGRIMRIAVHPQQRRCGLGSRLLSQLKLDAPMLGWDYLGSSFAASPDLLPFWQENGYRPVRLGQGRDLVSGCHAALVIQGISESFGALQSELQTRFQQQLPLLLGRIYHDLEPELLLQLIETPDRCWQLSPQDRRDLHAFARHNRMLESCLIPLQKLLRCGVNR